MQVLLKYRQWYPFWHILMLLLLQVPIDILIQEFAGGLIVKGEK